MIKHFTIMFLFIFTISAFSANPKIEKIFKKYDGKHGFTTVNVTKDMFSMFMQMDNSQTNKKTLKQSLSKIDGIKIMNYTADSLQNISKTLFSELKGAIADNDYKELLVINDAGSQVKMLVRKNGEIINDFVMLVGEANEVVLINISGELDLEALKQISNSMNIDGMDGIDESTIKGE